MVRLGTSTELAEKTVKEEKALLQKEGVKMIKLPPDEAEKYVATAYRVKWEEIGKKVSADTFAKLKELKGN